MKSVKLRFNETRFKNCYMKLVIKLSAGLLINVFIFGNQIQTLTYYDKFAAAVDYYKDGRFRLAEARFTNILIHEKDYKDPAAQLLLAKSQYQQNRWVDAARSSKSVLSNFPDSPYETDAIVLLGDIALASGKVTTAFQYYLSIRPKIEDLLYLNDIDKRLFTAIGIGLKEDRIEGLLFRERNLFNREIINLARAYQSWKNGDSYDLEITLKSIDTFYLPGYFASIFGALVEEKNSNLDQSVTIAILLPLSGTEKSKGESYLVGLSESINKNPPIKSNRYLIYDTGGSGVMALKIVKKIASDNSIKGILGPLTHEEIFSLSGFRAPLPILLPKSTISGLSSLNQNLFFLSPSSKTIAQRTAQMMVREMGYENIAVLSPGDGESKLKTDYFLKECHSLGVDPVAVEWYIEKPEDLSRQLKNIRGIAWDLVPEKEIEDNSINLEIDSLDALFDVDVSDFFELPIEEEETMDRKDSSRVVLETIQAIYIPIRQNELTYVGTQLPFYNLKTTLFGNENWLDMDLLNQEVIGPHVQGMRVISDVSSAISNEGQDLFTNFYTLAIDHSDFIQSVIRDGAINRKQFIDRLRDQSDYIGLNTSIIFMGKNNNENGSAQVLQYQNKSLKNLGVYDGESFNYTSK